MLRISATETQLAMTTPESFDHSVCKSKIKTMFKL